MLEPDHASRVAPVDVAPATAFGEKAGPHALQILMTEHWSLLFSRSLGYTEAMSCASIFVAALTGSVVALALVGQATDAVVAGAIAAIAALGLGAGTALAVIVGVLVFVVVLTGFAAFAFWAVTRFRGTLDVRFPTPPR
jgi:hypothetical protein